LSATDRTPDPEDGLDATEVLLLVLVVGMLALILAIAAVTSAHVAPIPGRTETMETKPRLAHVNGTPEAAGAEGKAQALVAANRDALEQLARWAVSRHHSEATHLLMCIAVEPWVWLAERLSPPGLVKALRAAAATKGGTAMVCGFQPPERVVALMREHYELDLTPMLSTPPPAPGEWRVVVCFDGGMAIGGVPTSASGGCNAPGGDA
jgi:hypothetical protein